MTQQEWLVMQLCVFLSSLLRPRMINYFEFQLPDPAPSDSPLHFPPSPSPSSHLSFPLCPPFALDFPETLESQASPISNSLSPVPLPSQKQAGRRERRGKNETKNIPKNFGKGIISFIQCNEKKVRGLLRQERLTFSCFIEMMREEKKRINTISDLRQLWTHEMYGKCLRAISNLFLRKHALHYIFNSRITNYASHIKYRQSLWKALADPQHFTRIKEY